MSTSNIIKNTAIIALSISTTIGIIQTCGAKQETKAAETKTKNATTQVIELKNENAKLKNRLAAKPKTITKTVTEKVQSSDPYSLPQCTHEDYSQKSCVWRATDRGNNRGMTYMVDANGYAWYRDDAILGEMIGWTDYM